MRGRRKNNVRCFRSWHVHYVGNSNGLQRVRVPLMVLVRELLGDSLRGFSLHPGALRLNAILVDFRSGCGFSWSDSALKLLRVARTNATVNKKNCSCPFTLYVYNRDFFSPRYYQCDEKCRLKTARWIIKLTRDGKRIHNIARADDILWSDVAINYANDKTTVYNDIKTAVRYIHTYSVRGGTDCE